jgi:hypothetical protein
MSAQPSIQRARQDVSPGAKRQRREANYSLPSGVEVEDNADITAQPRDNKKCVIMVELKHLWPYVLLFSAGLTKEKSCGFNEVSSIVKFGSHGIVQ